MEILRSIVTRFKQPQKKKVAVLYIATGRYIKFWEDFYITAKKYFLVNHDITYFLFTDSDTETSSDVRLVKHNFRGWPEETLMRFDTFLKVEDELKNFDYIYFTNANLIACNPIDEKIFPTEKQGLMVTLHPYFYKKPRKTYTYDNNPESLAFIPDNKGKYYFMGGFNGGTSNAYLKLIRDLDKAVKTDYEKGIIALWHDESHLNKYMLDKKPLILKPEYVFPEELFKNKIKFILLNKQKLGGHNYMRQIDDKFIEQL